MHEKMSSPEHRFLRWLHDCGASFPYLSWPHEFAWGRGAVAISDVPAGKTVLSIPERLHLSIAKVHEDAPLRRALDTTEELWSDDLVVLALFVMREMERGEGSFYAPYLAILPEPDGLLDWSHEERLRLDHGAAFEVSTRRVFDLYERLVAPMVREHPELFSAASDLERFRFALRTVQSRAFGQGGTSLIPMADCLNHANVAVRKSMASGEDGRLFEIAHLEGVAKGAEVLNSYGRIDNLDLLTRYGFCLEDNIHERYDIELHADMERIPAGERASVCSTLGAERSAYLKLGSQDLPREALSVARLASLDPSDVEALRGRGLAVPSHTGHELRSLFWLKKRLSAELREHPTSIEDDREELLCIGRREPRYRWALIYRIGQKSILTLALERVDRLIQALEESATKGAPGGHPNAVAARLDAWVSGDQIEHTVEYTSDPSANAEPGTRYLHELGSVTGSDV